MINSIPYKIKNFTENKMSIEGIRNITTSIKTSFWQSESDEAMLEITFSATKALTIVIGNSNIGIMAPLKLNILYGSDLLLSKSYKTKDYKYNTIPLSKLIAKYDKGIEELAIKFIRIDSFIKVCSLILTNNDRLKPENGLKPFMDTRNVPKAQGVVKKRAVFTNNDDKYEVITLKPVPDKKNNDLQDDFYENSFSQQQKRLSALVSNGSSFYAAEKADYEQNTDRRITNSYVNLLNGHVIWCIIDNFELKCIIIELIQAAGAVYVEDLDDYCTVVLYEPVLFEYAVSMSNRIPVVPIEWLIKTISTRKIQNFENFNLTHNIKS